jgi:hypothetical protein
MKEYTLISFEKIPNKNQYFKVYSKTIKGYSYYKKIKISKKVFNDFMNNQDKRLY